MKLSFEQAVVSSNVLRQVREEQQKSREKELAELILNEENQCQQFVDRIIKLRAANRAEHRKYEKSVNKLFSRLEKCKNPHEFSRVIHQNGYEQLNLRSSPEDYASE